ncbi:MAG: ABC transporter ATP-binding protein [Candidatus Aminicenantes bacterium]|nr:ABC transporter ATP-binding protein [Candidatus Aminicenantes bacterium]
MIKTNKMVKVFTTEEVETTALNGINLEVKGGEFVAIMGPSGCGKSTLLNIVGLLDNPTSGELNFDGTEVSKFKEKHRTELRKGSIGFVFQSFNLIDELTVYENIEMPLLYQKVKGSERKSMVCDILDKFNIVGKKDLFPNQLSGGQQQLVGIARAIIGKPSLLLADEPTGNLDWKTGEKVFQLFRELIAEKELTAIIVTHNEQLAGLVDRRLHLQAGKLDESSTG